MSRRAEDGKDTGFWLVVFDDMNPLRLAALAASPFC